MSRWNLVLMSLFAVVAMLVSTRKMQAQQFPEKAYQELHWRMIGPTRGGRTRAACGVLSQPNVFYVGAVNGGVWKTDDFGRTWTPIFDAQPTQSIGAIAVAPSDPNIVYVSSGEGLARPDLSLGNGIYKSTDAGKTWKHLGLRNGQGIPSLAVDPHNPDHILAAVLGHPYGANEERGIFLSMDGGQNWQRTLYKNENVGGSDVEMDPTNPDVVYAALWEVRLGPWEDGNQYNGTGGGLFKSTDGGKTWRSLSNGLPKGLIQLNVGIAPSQSSRLYATVASKRDENSLGSDLGVYRSDDAGENWKQITTDPRPSGRIGGGDLPIPRVDPKNPDRVIVASTVTMKSTDGGKTWMGFRGAPGGDDYQNLWINPDNPDIILLVGDQGALVTVNGGRSWSSWYNQPTAQLYHVVASNSFPYLVCSGQQESGSVCVSSRGNDGEITFRDWHPVGVIEYGYAAPDPLNPEIIYGAGRREVSRYSITTGQVQNVSPIPLANPKYRADRTQPILFSPVDPHTLYYAANFVFKTVDGGQNWQTISPDLARTHAGIPASVGKSASKDGNADKQRGVVYALAPSFRDLSTLWAGTDDGLIWSTHDGGANWKDVTPHELTSWSKVTQLVASHFDDVSAYASVSRFRVDDLRPYIYRTHDDGKTWTLITTGLPSDAPVDTIREDPLRKGLLFAGTETSVWVSFDDGDHWQSLQLNLPHTSMRDLWIHEDDLIVGTHGRSFWVLDNISPLRQLTDAVSKAGAFLFKPAPAVRVRRDTNTDTPIPPDEPTAPNPPDGAVVDYFLAEDASGPVVLEISDSEGKLVRRYASTDKPATTDEELAQQLIPLYWIRKNRSMPTAAGMHRWLWDLHYPAPNASRYEYPISAIPGDTPREPLGPRALPGSYTIRLKVNGETLSQPLTVRMDPRVKASAGDLTQIYRMQSRLAALMTEVTRALGTARSVRDQLEKVNPTQGGSLAASISDFGKKLATVLGGGPPGGSSAATLVSVNGSISALYAELDRADAAPTAAQEKAVFEIEQGFAVAVTIWMTLQETDLPSLNDQLRKAHLSEIRPTVSQKSDDDSDDIE